MGESAEQRLAAMGIELPEPAAPTTWEPGPSEMAPTEPPGGSQGDS